MNRFLSGDSLIAVLRQYRLATTKDLICFLLLFVSLGFAIFVTTRFGQKRLDHSGGVRLMSVPEPVFKYLILIK